MKRMIHTLFQPGGGLWQASEPALVAKAGYNKQCRDRLTMPDRPHGDPEELLK